MKAWGGEEMALLEEESEGARRDGVVLDGTRSRGHWTVGSGA
jgi:hypothetical protein